VARWFRSGPSVAGPSLHRRYPASSLLRTHPPPDPARPVPRGLPVDRADDHRAGLPVSRPRSLQACRRPHPGGPMRGVVAQSLHGDGLRHSNPGSASASTLSRRAQRSLALRPAWSRSRSRRPVPPEASTVSLPPPPLRLLPAGATQLPGGTCTRKISAPWHSARSKRVTFGELNEAERADPRPELPRGGYPPGGGVAPAPR
jgi:hypothetical protein